VPASPRSLAERFWSKVDKAGEDECWLWTASLNHYGYGQIQMLGPLGWRPTQASRVAYTLTHGPIPEGGWVLHSCDTPACCNPAHLRLGTPKENSQDMVNRGRAAKPGARITPDDVRDIRRRGAHESQHTIAHDFPLSPSQVNRIINKKRWKDVV
jgi:uncharacterized protein (DUF433 family)